MKETSVVARNITIVITVVTEESAVARRRPGAALSKSASSEINWWVRTTMLRSKRLVRRVCASFTAAGIPRLFEVCEPRADARDNRTKRGKYDETKKCI